MEDSRFGGVIDLPLSLWKVVGGGLGGECTGQGRAGKEGKGTAATTLGLDGLARLCSQRAERGDERDQGSDSNSDRDG